MKSEPLQPATLQNALGGYFIEEVERELILREAECAIAAEKIPQGLTPEKVYSFLAERRIDLHNRALIPKNTRRVLAAGRIVSSDTEANSALRVQAPCMAMGQAAGCAAALAVQKECDVANVPYQALKELLLKQGAIVPEI